MKKPRISEKAKLTPAQVRWVRQMHLREKPQAEMAEHLGVSQPVISNIILGKTYRNV